MGVFRVAEWVFGVFGDFLVLGGWVLGLYLVGVSVGVRCRSAVFGSWGSVRGLALCSARYPRRGAGMTDLLSRGYDGSTFARVRREGRRGRGGSTLARVRREGRALFGDPLLMRGWGLGLYLVRAVRRGQVW